MRPLPVAAVLKMVLLQARLQVSSLLTATIRRCYSNGQSGMMGSVQGAVNVFDRKAKRLQRNRAAMADDAATYDYLRDEVSHHCMWVCRCLLKGILKHHTMIMFHFLHTITPSHPHRLPPTLSIECRTSLDSSL